MKKQYSKILFRSLIVIVLIFILYDITLIFGITSMRTSVILKYKNKNQQYPYLRGFYGYPVCPFIVMCQYQFIDPEKSITIKGSSWHFWYIFGNIEISDSNNGYKKL